MFKSMEAWKYPIGTFIPKDNYTVAEVQAAIKELKAFPKQLKATLKHCPENNLNTPYRPGGWTMNQLVHHIADSHMHAYIRCKFAYLEDRPTIKAYQEQHWAEKSPDVCVENIDASLRIIEGVHQRWTYFFGQLSAAELARTYQHPERDQPYTLAEVACFYAWHAKHHLAHLREALSHQQ